MLTPPIPSTGEAMPVIGLGTWQVFEVGADEPVRRPLRAVLQLLFEGGGRMIDTSPMYGREPEVDFVQLGYSLATRAPETELLPIAAERGVAVIVNQPFEQGDLFRRVRGRALPEWAREFDCTSWVQLFLKYILAEPAVTCVIPAANNPAHMTDDLGAGFGTLPDARQRQQIRELRVAA